MPQGKRAKPGKQRLPAPRPELTEPELVRVLVALGTSPEAAEAAVRRGDPESAVFEPVLTQGRLERTVSPAEVEAGGGLTATQTSAIMEAFGFPPVAPDEASLSPAEAEVLVELHRLREVWPAELTLQLGRLYGRMLARIAGAEVQAFRQYSVPRLQATYNDRGGELEAVQAAFQRLLPLADPLLIGVHRRWVEHELAQAAVRDAELHAGIARLPGAVEIAFLFCDLKDFTRYAELEGDEAAIVAIDAFFDVITRKRGAGGRVVKALGDGAMLAYDDPQEAVSAGLRVINATRSTKSPGVHASVHQGMAIAREGDYFGGSVNLAARLLSLGGRDELLATEPVVKAAGDRFAWEPMGKFDIRGMASPVAVFRLRGAPRP